MQLRALMQEQIEKYGVTKLNFICTHNSRRSQLSEMWLRAACEFYGINNIQAYSGGTVNTAFNERMVRAIQQKGFPLEKLSTNANPIYTLSSQLISSLMFSKVYNDTNNPKQGFIAVMVCDNAEQNCPLVHGADHRFSLKYVDPKFSDDTNEERKVYESKVDEIGIELLYLVATLAPVNI